ncbi:DUF6361 family protein [Moellerella wisconsensis]|uniref:DUF6361 family protein n=2 Tax=Moellerella wisconsensis TaxID=158849 RepID=A0ACD3Y823_9GAMM|nr:DUF6361 family protein [Moellerella wisconsensis]UNH24456.1 DUF6361 family protein [Moellerella wisconsensis]UNH27560.1 DUF6361 family protein [Moellerella wisconsensis]UNH31034.1 DUF6361 family protein [Moellerella wisconsensis]UNH39180.1 DUF6361 family protein [Moellerella wisconsensis]UNH42701.1 DUF6361 family protein [Moellerella wisconsensis]
MGGQTSSIGWIDYSSLERERVSQILSMLQEKGTLDELGIGQIRDAFADQLFPGISTIQTRAKYFVTIPYIFHDYRRLARPNRPSLNDYISQQEDQLAKCLVENHKQDIPYGIIGKDSLEKGVARKPSSVYWNGLRQLSIAKTELSLREFITQYQELANRPSEQHIDDDNQYSDIAQWMTKPEGYDESWLEQVSIALTPNEAEFLNNKFLLSKKIEHSVPTQLIKHHLVDNALQVADMLTQGVWQAEALYDSLKDSSISAKTKNCFQKALQFSFALEGAHIRYNVLIAQRAHNIKQLEWLNQQFELWLNHAHQQLNNFEQQSIDSWYQAAFGHHKKSNNRTLKFIENWCNLIRENAPTETLDTCVRQQAIANKGARCLLKKALNENQGWVGMRKLEFRWPSARIILKDIQEGLNARSG